MTTFFSVDVETTGPDPASGQLLTVGIQVVEDLKLTKTFYFGQRFHESGHKDPDTMIWWEEQDPTVRMEAFGTFLNGSYALAYKLQTFLDQFPASRWFVANPAAFDRAFINDLFSTQNLRNPFHYRSLCLRSMRFGLTPNQEWGESRTDRYENPMPHHALHDATEQALDLIYLLKKRDDDESSS